MSLEQMSSNVEANTDLKTEINEAIRNCTEDVDKAALDTISKLNEKQLATYIKTSFYDQNEEAWENYSTMRSNKYHTFMVQAAIDLLSDKYGDQKYNIKGETGDGDGFKSLDDWIGEGGIDNRMGGKTSTAVKVLQNKWHFIADGYAGPQFFAKVCAELENSSLPANFKVKGKENYSNKYGLNKTQSVVIEGANGGESQTIEFDTPSDIEVKYENSVYRIYRNNENTGFYLSGTPGSFVVKRPYTWEGSKGDFEIDNTNNRITYKGSSETNRGSLEIFGKTVKLPSGYTFGEADAYNNQYAKDHLAWSIFYNGKYCGNNFYYNEGLEKYSILCNKSNENYRELLVQDDGNTDQILIKEASQNSENIGQAEVTGNVENEEATVLKNLDNLKEDNVNYKQYDRFALKINGQITYYALNSRHNLCFFYGGTDYKRYESYTSGGRYERVYREINAGAIRGLFDKVTYDSITHVRNLINKSDTKFENMTTDMLAGYGKMINSDREDSDNLANLAKWAMNNNSSNRAGGGDFINWCDTMRSKGLPVDGMTLNTRLAFSKLDESGIDKIYFKKGGS